MTLTDRQNLIRDRISAEVKPGSAAEIVHCSEWLGYLPFGVYQWIECNQQAAGTSHPVGKLKSWQLWRLRFLEKIGEWQDPQDDFNRKITFKVHLDEGPT